MFFQAKKSTASKIKLLLLHFSENMLGSYTDTRPSVAKALEGIFRQLRLRLRLFLQAKKIYGQQDKLAIRSFSERWWLEVDSNHRKHR